METRNDQDARDKVFALLKGIRIAMLASRGDDGAMHARPMAISEATSFDGELWFFTDVHSPKIEEIRRDPAVLLTFADDDRQHYVSVAGKAEIVRDVAKQKELWSEGNRTWFPRGAEDPDIALIRVTVDIAEYWDAPSSTMVYAYGYLKAVTTGKRPDPGENATVTFGKARPGVSDEGIPAERLTAQNDG